MATHPGTDVRVESKSALAGEENGAGNGSVAEGGRSSRPILIITIRHRARLHYYLDFFFSLVRRQRGGPRSVDLDADVIIRPNRSSPVSASASAASA